MSAFDVQLRRDALLQVRGDFDRLRGRLFELLEAMGLGDQQTEAGKKLVRRLTYDMQASLERKLR